MGQTTTVKGAKASGQMIPRSSWFCSIAAAGIGPARDTLRPAFDAALKATFDAATLPLAPLPTAITGGRQGRHSEHLGHILSEMQFLPRAYPGATW